MNRIEKLSGEIHQVYCRYYSNRYGKEYWTKGDYSKLDEETKDADRAMAHFVLNKLKQLEVDRDKWEDLYIDLHTLHAEGKIDNSEKLIKENQRLKKEIEQFKKDYPFFDDSDSGNYTLEDGKVLENK